jgi:RNA ligase (TIGR02306 family)
MQFMKATNWRVKMRRFKGAPSEVVIMPIPEDLVGGNVIGDDVTTFFGVTKYQKPVPPNLQGRVLGDFPWFIPKTDEPNYQSCPELVDKLFGKPYYITEKVDGSSCTAYKYNGKFGLCSRNWELAREETNGYWKVALKYDLENNLPEGIAVQFEICGPKVQKNPMGLSELDGFVFSGFNINEKRYMRIDEIGDLCIYLKMNMVKVIDAGINFFPTGIESLGEGTYANGNQREGVVVRSQENFDGKPISFKVINLNYET